MHELRPRLVLYMDGGLLAAQLASVSNNNNIKKNKEKEKNDELFCVCERFG